MRPSSGARGVQAGSDDYSLHALSWIVERTQMVLGEMTPLLLILWREKHPHGKEQLSLPLGMDVPNATQQLILPVEIEEGGACAKRRLDI